MWSPNKKVSSPKWKTPSAPRQSFRFVESRKSFKYITYRHALASKQFVILLNTRACMAVKISVQNIHRVLRCRPINLLITVSGRVVQEWMYRTKISSLDELKQRLQDKWAQLNLPALACALDQETSWRDVDFLLLSRLLFWLLPENYEVNYCFGNLRHSRRPQQ